MATFEDRPRRQLPGIFAVGIGVGVLAGLLVEFVPLVLFAGLMVLAVAWTVREVARADPLGASFWSGILLGVGGLFTYGVVNSIVPCLNTADYCGGSNDWPLIGFTLAILATGTVGAVTTLIR